MGVRFLPTPSISKITNSLFQDTADVSFRSVARVLSTNRSLSLILSGLEYSREITPRMLHLCDPFIEIEKSRNTPTSLDSQCE